MRKSIFLAAAVLAAALTAGSALAAHRAASASGIVVASQHGVLLVASPTGVVRAFNGNASTGDRVAIAGTRLTVTGRAQRAVVRGVVVRNRGNLTFLSAAKHVFVVRAKRTTASAKGAAPVPGTIVQATVGIASGGELDEENEQQLGTSGDVAVQALVTAVGVGTVTISVNGQPLVIPLPAGLTLPVSVIGTQVSLTLSFPHGGALSGDDESGDDGVTASATVGGSGTSLSITGQSTPPNSVSHSGGGGDH